jgi:hypothetical protein
MTFERTLISRLFIVGVSAVGISGRSAPAADLDLSPLLGQAATYDYVAPQVAPPIASGLSTDQIAAILNQNVVPLPDEIDAYQQTTVTDATGSIASLAPLKVVQTPLSDHPYLGVFHNQVTNTKFATYAAYSLDLKTWHTLGAIDDISNQDFGSQPDIRVLPDESVLFAEEYNGKSVNQPQIRVRFYGNAAQTGLLAFIADPTLTPTVEKILPGIPFSKADGTPAFGRIQYNNSIRKSKIEIPHHYFNFGIRDLPAIGTLTNFQNWSDTGDTTTNNLVTNAGGNGKIGDRDVFKVGSTVYEVVEAQVKPASGNDYSSWRLFLVNITAGTARQLSPMLVGGALSLGNPTLSFVTLPGGVHALVFTCFVFSVNNGTTLAGGHMFVYPLE